MSRTAAILNRLVQMRRNRNWTQAEMGRRIGLTEEAFRSMEKGRTIRLEWDTIVLLTELVAESGMTWIGFLAPADDPVAPPTKNSGSAAAAQRTGGKSVKNGPKPRSGR